MPVSLGHVDLGLVRYSRFFCISSSSPSALTLIRQSRLCGFSGCTEQTGRRGRANRVRCVKLLAIMMSDVSIAVNTVLSSFYDHLVSVVGQRSAVLPRPPPSAGQTNSKTNCYAVNSIRQPSRLSLL